MNDEIIELVKKYNENRDENERIKVEHEKKRKSFVEDFPINSIDKLNIKDFVLGKIDGIEAKNRGPKQRGTFMYRMEHENRNLTKFEESIGKEASSWYINIRNQGEKMKWGCSNISDKDEYNKTIQQIKKVLDVKYQNDYKVLLSFKPLSEIVICKLLVTYYPKKFLPNGSDKYAKKFLEKVGVTYNNSENVLELNNHIIQWKNSNLETKSWDNMDISRFMYGSDYMNLKQETKNEKKDENVMEKDNKTSRKDQNKNLLDLKMNKNIILYGPPGTGKTYSTIAYALSICCGDKKYEEYLIDLKNNRKAVMDIYNRLKKEGRVSFVTFHQSYGYEDFIQGIKPSSENGEILYDIEDGIFKAFCKNAINSDKKNKAKVDNFDETWKELIKYIEDNEYYEFEGKRGGKFRFRITKRGDSLFRFNEPHFSLTKENIYSVYRHEGKELKYRNYMKIVLKFMKNELGLKDYEKGNENPKQNNYVFIIDEINRGNISKIFGELITLIETDKRIGEVNELKVKLPNQGEDEEDFGIPSNIYIIGTMNTADRSIALLDTALRRRFKFVEMMPDYDVLNEIKIDDLSIKDVAKKINERIEVLFDREHTIGHAYYLKLNNNKTVEGLTDLFKNHIIPLLQEYFFDDYEKIRYILGDNGKDEKYQFIQRKEVKFNELFNENIEKNNDDGLTDDDLKVKYNINDNAFNEIESYKGI